MVSVPSLRYFEESSEKTGFLPISLEKVYRITQILKEIFTADLSNYLALRGGTAINFCYQKIPRLSVDIDAVYVRSYKKKVMQDDRKRITDSLRAIFEFLKYKVECRRHYALDQYFLIYKNIAGRNDSIKLEVNYIASRVPILKPKESIMNVPFDIEYPIVTTLAPEELYGSKVKAFIERRLARDSFDIYLLNSLLGKIDFKLLKRSSILYCTIELKSDIRDIDLLALINSINERSAKRELRPLLRKGMELDIDKVKEDAFSILSNIFKLDKYEKEYVDSFYSFNYKPELLFPDNALLRYHPGAKWRLKHLK